MINLGSQQPYLRPKKCKEYRCKGAPHYYPSRYAHMFRPGPGHHVTRFVNHFVTNCVDKKAVGVALLCNLLFCTERFTLSQTGVELWISVVVSLCSSMGRSVSVSTALRVADQLVAQKIVAPMQGNVTLGFTSITSLSCGSGSPVCIETGWTVRGSNPRGGRDFLPVQTGLGANPSSCAMGTGPFPGVKCGRGVLLTSHSLLAPRSWKSTSTSTSASVYPLLGHNRVCNGVTLPLLFYFSLMVRLSVFPYLLCRPCYSRSLAMHLPLFLYLLIEVNRVLSTQNFSQKSPKGNSHVGYFVIGGRII
jgi:hypothetical protein